MLGFLARQSLNRTLRDAHFASALQSEVGTSSYVDGAEDGGLMHHEENDQQPSAAAQLSQNSIGILSSALGGDLLPLTSDSTAYHLKIDESSSASRANNLDEESDNNATRPAIPADDVVPNEQRNRLQQRIFHLLKSLHLAFAADIASQFEDLIMEPQRGGAWFVTNPAHTADSVVEKPFPAYPTKPRAPALRSQHQSSAEGDKSPQAETKRHHHQLGNCFGAPIVATTISCGECDVQLTALTSGGAGGANGALLLTGAAFEEVNLLRRQFGQLLLPSLGSVLQNRSFAPEGIYQDRPFLLTNVSKGSTNHPHSTTTQHRHQQELQQQLQQQQELRAAAAQEALTTRARTQLQQIRFILCSESFLNAFPAAPSTTAAPVVHRASQDSSPFGESRPVATTSFPYHCHIQQYPFTSDGAAVFDFDAVRIRVFARRLRLLQHNNDSGGSGSASSANAALEVQARQQKIRDKKRKGRRGSIGLPSASSIQLGASFSTSTFASGLGSAGRSRGSRSGSVALLAPSPNVPSGPPATSDDPVAAAVEGLTAMEHTVRLMEMHQSGSLRHHSNGHPPATPLSPTPHFSVGQQPHNAANPPSSGFLSPHEDEHNEPPQFVVGGNQRFAATGSAPGSVGVRASTFVSPFVTANRQLSVAQQVLPPPQLQQHQSASAQLSQDVQQTLKPTSRSESPRGNAMTPIGLGGVVVPMLQLSHEYMDHTVTTTAMRFGGTDGTNAGLLAFGSGFSEPQGSQTRRRVKESPSSSSMNELLSEDFPSPPAPEHARVERGAGSISKRLQLQPPQGSHVSSGAIDSSSPKALPTVFVVRSFSLTLICAKLRPAARTVENSRDDSPVFALEGVRTSITLPSSSSSLAIGPGGSVGARQEIQYPSRGSNNGAPQQPISSRFQKHFSASISAGASAGDEASAFPNSSTGIHFSNAVVVATNPLVAPAASANAHHARKLVAAGGGGQLRSAAVQQRLSFDSEGSFGTRQRNFTDMNVPQDDTTTLHNDSNNNNNSNRRVLLPSTAQLLEVSAVASHLTSAVPAAEEQQQPRTLTPLVKLDSSKPLATFNAFGVTANPNHVHRRSREEPEGNHLSQQQQHYERHSTPNSQSGHSKLLFGGKERHSEATSVSQEAVDPAAMRTTWGLFDEFIDPRYEAAFLSNVDDLYRAERGLFFSCACLLFAVILIFIVYVVYDDDIPQTPRGYFPGVYVVCAAILATAAIVIQIVVMVSPSLWQKTIAVPMNPASDNEEGDSSDMGSDVQEDDDEGVLPLTHLDPRRRRKQRKTERNRRQRMRRPAYVAPTPFRTTLRRLNVISWLAYCALIFAAIVAAPIGNVLGNGRMVWLYCLTCLSIVRSPSLKPVYMWATGELPISLAFLVDAAARADRFAFASQQHLLLIADDIVEKEDQVAKIVSDMAPKGAAREFIDRFAEIFASVAVQLRQIALAMQQQQQQCNEIHNGGDSARAAGSPMVPAAVPEVYRSLLTQQAGYGGKKHRVERSIELQQQEEDHV
ncbi:transmembrane protein, putative [Bodo saltans]|uniref:Transmembrane protein, putative n=1 Tax=Bodo saltans TaxID=75058 RepID=A0A0S4IR29_BODSA|nr:transmembrane protein, putative [Bodo saltans]|eukprot:CUF38696.1 transmembrane protein, putative [Bodo saltans]